MVRCLMFQGTGSSVGKSVLVAGVARALTNMGYRVLPFKPQNMSNNAAVTADGGEIGRAQALQALACRVEPVVHMNPVLLKPQSGAGSQIVVQGRVWGQANARAYQELKPKLLGYVRESFEILAGQADIVLVEGAGSASEINLRRHDIANMGFAQAIKAPVILVGDIDRGGIIASLVGTHAVLPQDDLSRIKGFIVNKMRGDPSLFMESMGWIAQRTGWKDLGLLPYFAGLDRLPAEDAADLRGNRHDLHHERKGTLRISVLLLPTIANFDDFDPLRHEPGVQLVFIPVGQPVPIESDVIIIPGSKNTIADLGVLYQTGWNVDIHAHVRQGKHVLGICGGYQMLGKRILDPGGIESVSRSMKGLGFFNMITQLAPVKQLRKVKGHLSFEPAACSGYEMHMGVTTHKDVCPPFAYLEHARQEGGITCHGKVMGTYLHGVFHHDEARRGILAYFGTVKSQMRYHQEIDSVLEDWSAHIARHVSIHELFSISSLL